MFFIIYFSNFPVKSKQWICWNLLKIFFNRFHIYSYYSRFLRELYPYDCDLSLSRGCTMSGITNAGSSYVNSKDPSICILHFRILFLLCPRSNLVWSIVVVSLLAKLEKYGLEESALKMFRSYLDDRWQVVEWASSMRSRPLSLAHGVPQGSVPGPLMFIVIWFHNNAT